MGNRTGNDVTVLQPDNSTASWQEDYTYDSLSRLTEASYTNPSLTVNYAYDAMGNRTSDQPGGTPNYFYDAANRLRRHNSAIDNYSYDANGNTESGGGRANTWDTQNLLVSCTYNGTTSAFTYGSDGLRRSMTVDTSPSVHYALDGQNVAQEGSLDVGTGEFEPNATFLTGPRGTECRFDLLASTDKERWYVLDGLGSVLAEVNELGEVKSCHRCDVWGSDRLTSVQQGDPKSEHAFVGSLGHTTSPDTGLIYMRARYYDPAIGRFISEDPARDGTNWYAYCGNNPANTVDPDGMLGFDAWEAFKAIAGAGASELYKKYAKASVQQVVNMMVAAARTKMKQGAREYGWGAAEMVSSDMFGMLPGGILFGEVEQAAAGVSMQAGARDFAQGVALMAVARVIQGLSFVTETGGLAAGIAL